MPLFFERVNDLILGFRDPYGLVETPAFTTRPSDSLSDPGIPSPSQPDRLPNYLSGPSAEGKSNCPPSPPRSLHDLPGRLPSDPSIDQSPSVPLTGGVLKRTEDDTESSGPYTLPAIIHASQGILEGAKDFEIKNSFLTNVQGNATIFRFEAGSIPDEEFKSVFIKHMAGSITVRDLDTIEKRTLIQAIRDLPRAKAAYDDYVARDGRRTSCFEGTRQELLGEIAQCITGSDGPRAYLLFGIAGVGKSTVAQTVAERAVNLRLLGASFFFSRDEVDRRNAEKFFTTIAFQLCTYDVHFAEAIGTALTELRGAAATSKDPQRQLEALILEPLRAIAKTRLLPTVIVVDALDECDVGDGPIVLMALDQLVRELPFFKVVLTTRPQPHLQYLLKRLGAHQVFKMEDIEQKVVEGDIRLYLEYSLGPEYVHSRLPMLHREWAASEEEINVLVKAAGRLFIIASTAVLFILDTAAYSPASRIKILHNEFSQDRTTFKTLNNFYAVILRSAVPLGCERDIVDRYQAVVGTILLIEDPLPVGALTNLNSMLEEDLRAVLVNLQSVISLGNNDVPLLYHKSFLDYITDGRRCQDTDLCIVPRDHQTRLATRCLRIMNGHLKRNILGLGPVSQYLNNDQALEEEHLSWDSVRRAIPSELQYSSVHWANHLVRADIEDNDLVSELKAFTEEHLLHWLEALSWVHKLSVVYVSLSAVLKLKTLNLDIFQIFSDALRFVSRHYENMEEFALFVYHSALPFVPTETLLYRKYEHQIRLCQVKGGPEQWDILVAKKSHGEDEVSHVTFMNDNSQFASWAEGNMKLWDAASGTPIRTFDGDLTALADDFSALAMAQGGSVTMYGATSGAPTAYFNHSSMVVKMAVSFDGSRLAAGLGNGTVTIWDAKNGVSIASLHDYNDGILVFFPHRYTLAFTSTSGINLWTGADVAVRLEHELEWPVRLVISADCTRLATIAENDGPHNLRLWDGENGHLIAVTRGVGDVLATSADGSLIATGGQWSDVRLWSGDSLLPVDRIHILWIWDLMFWGRILAIAARRDHAVTLYDVEEKTLVATLPISSPSSLAFSPDGVRLAAGNSFGIVHLWDFSSIEAFIATSKLKRSPVSALTFSPDCSRLASGRRDGSVELWDTAQMGEAIACHKLHSGWLTALAFSPDGKQLASGSRDKKVRFWDGRDGSPECLVSPSPDEPTTLALSSSLLAVATWSSVTLWDRPSLRRVHTSDKGSSLLSFSLDGSVLASGDSQNVTVQETEKFTILATFSSLGTMLFASPDGSKLAIYSKDYGFQLFDIVKKRFISDAENKDFGWFPQMKGVPMSWRYLNHDEVHLVGRLSARHRVVPMLWIPLDFDVWPCAGQLSMFALGCGDGRILLVQSFTGHR